MTDFAFPPDTLAFLADLRANNHKAWFEANRDRYQSAYVEPAMAFVEAAGPVLDEIVPGINAEPRILGSIFRINQNRMYVRDRPPYKDHLDLWFWEGERKAAVSGLFVRVTPDWVGVGAGAHHFDKDRFGTYRAALGRPGPAKELVDAVERVERAGYPVGGEKYARTPKVALGDPAAERLLRHNALFMHHELPRELAHDRQLIPILAEHWRAMAPVHRWLTAHVQGARSRVP
ncbi:MAG TPA: DUF2461 domain-containing protein [Pseudonocardiaceae bacterium]|jgi:uncharacterized protein (TIGR02453 family)